MKKETKMKKLWILGLLLLPFAAGCSSLCFWKKAATTQVSMVDEDLRPVANVTVVIKEKLGDEYVLVPRSAFETLGTTTQPTAAKKPAVRPAKKATPARTPAAQDNKMRISYDGGIKIRIRCPQKFGAADVFPGRGGDWHLASPDVTADGYLDPEVIAPIIEAVRERNQARLAANPRLTADKLEFVCFNFNSPTGEKRPEHLTNDGGWAMVTPTSAEPGGRIVLAGGVVIVGEIASADENGHRAGDRIHAFAVIPQ